MTADIDHRPPPPELGERSAAFWLEVVERWDLDGPGYALLVELCSAMERAEQARALLDAEGLTVTDRYGQTKPHPAAGIENAASQRIARLLAALDLADEAEGEPTPRERHRRARYR